MRIRSFRAPTIGEAMAQVREAMGEDAIIISTHQGRRGRGVEIRAAVEPAPDPVASRAVAATLDETAAIEARLHARLRAELNPRAVGLPRVQGPHAEPPPPDLKEVGQALVFHRVPSALGKALLSDAKRFDAATGEDALAAAFETRYGFSPLPENPGRPILLIGPPGVGKTATAAKLAARSVLTGSPVSLMTTDTVKAGSVEQLNAFAGLLEVPAIAAETPNALADGIANAQGRTIFIDTPGTNPFDRAEREDLIEFLRVGNVEPVLVLAAGGDLADLVDTARIFQEMGVRRMILTRIDVARRLGSVLWLMQTTGLSFAQGSRTPYLADGLMHLDPAVLARLIMSNVVKADMTRQPSRPAVSFPNALKESS